MRLSLVNGAGPMQTVVQRYTDVPVFALGPRTSPRLPRMVIRFLAAFTVCSLCSLSAGASADDVVTKEATAVLEPADVFVHVTLVRDELEHLRFVMGRPENT